MIFTKEQIDQEVAEVSGTWVKRRNLRNKLIEISNLEVMARIEKIRSEVRALKAAGVNQQTLSPVYAKITELELKII